MLVCQDMPITIHRLELALQRKLAGDNQAPGHVKRLLFIKTQEWSGDKKGQ